MGRSNITDKKNCASSNHNITSLSSKLQIHLPEQSAKKDTALSFGEVIKKYRNKSGLSQTALAEIMETSRNTIINWESNKSRPDVENIRELCMMLGIPLSELFDIPTDDTPAKKEKTMLAQFRKLSSMSQKIVSRMVSTMYEEETDARDSYLRSSFMILPFQATAAAAGTGCEFTNLSPKPIFVKRSGLSESADTIIRVSGPSMEPLYHDNDLLYVELTNDVDDGNNVVCSTADGAVVKHKRENRLYSLNEQYPFGEKFEDDNVVILGKVLGIVGIDDVPHDEDMNDLENLLSSELREFYKKYGE